MNCSWLKSIVQKYKAWWKYNTFQCHFEINVPHGQSSVATKAPGAEIPEVALKIKLVKSEIAVAFWAFLTGASRKPISSGYNDTQENVSISAARRGYPLIKRESCQSTRRTNWCCKERETKERNNCKGSKIEGKTSVRRSVFATRVFYTLFYAVCLFFGSHISTVIQPLPLLNISWTLIVQYGLWPRQCWC